MKPLRYLFLSALMLVLTGTFSSCEDLKDPGNTIPVIETGDATYEVSEGWSSQSDTYYEITLTGTVLENADAALSANTYFLYSSTDPDLANAFKCSASRTGDIYSGSIIQRFTNITYYYAFVVENGYATIQGEIKSITIAEEAAPELQIGKLTFDLYGDTLNTDYCYGMLLDSDGNAASQVYEISRIGENSWSIPTIKLTDETVYLACWFGNFDEENGYIYLKKTPEDNSSFVYGVSGPLNKDNPIANIEAKSAFSKVTVDFVNSGSLGVSMVEMTLASEYIYSTAYLNMLTGKYIDGSMGVEASAGTDAESKTFTFFFIPNDNVENVWISYYALYADNTNVGEKVEITPGAWAANRSYTYTYDLAKEPIEQQLLIIDDLKITTPEGNSYQSDNLYYGAVLDQNGIKTTDDLFTIHMTGDGNNNIIFKTYDESGQNEKEIYLNTQDEYLMVWDCEATSPVFSNSGPIVSMEANANTTYAYYELDTLQAGHANIDLKNAYPSVCCRVNNISDEVVYLSSIQLTSSDLYLNGKWDVFGHNIEYGDKIGKDTFLKTFPNTNAIKPGTSTNYWFTVMPQIFSNSDTKIVATDNQGNIFTLEIPAANWFADAISYDLNVSAPTPEPQGQKLEIGVLYINGREEITESVSYQAMLLDSDYNPTQEKFYIKGSGSEWTTDRDIYFTDEDKYLLIYGEEVAYPGDPFFEFSSHIQLGQMDYELKRCFDYGIISIEDVTYECRLNNPYWEVNLALNNTSSSPVTIASIEISEGGIYGYGTYYFIKQEMLYEKALSYNLPLNVSVDGNATAEYILSGVLADANIKNQTITVTLNADGNSVTQTMSCTDYDATAQTATFVLKYEAVKELKIGSITWGGKEIDGETYYGYLLDKYNDVTSEGFTFTTSGSKSGFKTLSGESTTIYVTDKDQYLLLYGIYYNFDPTTGDLWYNYENFKFTGWTYYALTSSTPLYGPSSDVSALNVTMSTPTVPISYYIENHSENSIKVTSIQISWEGVYAQGKSNVQDGIWHYLEPTAVIYEINDNIPAGSHGDDSSIGYPNRFLIDPEEASEYATVSITLEGGETYSTTVAVEDYKKIGWTGGSYYTFRVAFDGTKLMGIPE